MMAKAKRVYRMVNDELGIETVVAIAGIVAMEAIALHNGINGSMLLIAFAAVSGLGGYRLGLVRSRKALARHGHEKSRETDRADGRR